MAWLVGRVLPPPREQRRLLSLWSTAPRINFRLSLWPRKIIWLATLSREERRLPRLLADCPTIDLPQPPNEAPNMMAGDC